MTGLRTTCAGATAILSFGVCAPATAWADGAMVEKSRGMGGCVTDPGDVPDLAAFEFANSTVTVTPSGVVNVTCVRTAAKWCHCVRNVRGHPRLSRRHSSTGCHREDHDHEVGTGCPALPLSEVERRLAPSLTSGAQAWAVCDRVSCSGQSSKDPSSTRRVSRSPAAQVLFRAAPLGVRYWLWAASQTAGDAGRRGGRVWSSIAVARPCCSGSMPRARHAVLPCHEWRIRRSTLYGAYRDARRAPSVRESGVVSALLTQACRTPSDDCLGTIRHLQLGEDAGHVVADGLGTEE